MGVCAGTAALPVGALPVVPDPPGWLAGVVVVEKSLEGVITIEGFDDPGEGGGSAGVEPEELDVPDDPEAEPDEPLEPEEE